MALFQNKRRSQDSTCAVTIAVCSRERARAEEMKRAYQAVFTGLKVQFLGITDARSLAEAYNRAISLAEAEYLILSHDDIRIITPDFAERFFQHLGTFDLIGVAGTSKLIGGVWFLAGHPYSYQLITSPERGGTGLLVRIEGRGPLIIENIQAIDGLFMGLRTAVGRNIRFDSLTFDGFHLYDLDFSYRCYLAGHRVAVCRDLFIVHDSYGSFDTEWQKYRRRFEEKFASVLLPHTEPIQKAALDFRLDPDALDDPHLVQQLCNPSTIRGMIDKIST